MASPKAFQASARADRKRRQEPRPRLRLADAAPAPTRRRLDHHGVAQPGGLAAAGLARRTAPPLHGATGTPTASAMRLAAILSPSARMASAVGPMKRRRGARRARRTRPLGDEPPARPGGVGLGVAAAPAPAGRGRGRRPAPPVRVDERRRPSPDLVGLPHEHGLPVRIGVQRDRPHSARARSASAAWMARIAGSPRLTIATREVYASCPRASRPPQGGAAQRECQTVR